MPNITRMLIMVYVELSYQTLLHDEYNRKYLRI